MLAHLLKVAAFQDVGVKVEPILILVSCCLFIAVVCVADSKINLHVPQLFHSADLEPGDKDMQRSSLAHLV